MQVYKPQYESKPKYVKYMLFFCTHTSISHFIFHSKSTMCGSIKHFWIKPSADQNVPGQPRLCDFFRALYHPGTSKNRGRLTSYGPQQL